MIVGETYRLNVAITGVQSVDGKHITVTIPKGELFSVNNVSHGKSFVECLWNGTELMLFSMDICERGTLV